MEGFTLTMNLIEKVRFVYYKNVTVRSEGRVVKRFHSELTRMERGTPCTIQTPHTGVNPKHYTVCTLCIVSIMCALYIVSIMCTLCIEA